MARTSRKQRFSMFAVSAVMVGGGVLLPTSAFAAPATPQVGEAATLVAGHVDHAKSGHESKGKKDSRGHKGKKHGKKNQGKGKKHGKIKDVKNMPGCKFYQGTVYCEHKPEKPAPTTETPTTETETPKTETPSTETETPKTETPSTETPATETETPAMETGEVPAEAGPGAAG
ncbi:hypothetical protein AB0B78_25675 [Streptomyces sp. NPDC040724]|uniref:hypothetical protein n=1 Tax=Streptomyces sp. NPDC040724 TaxID=3155612 RepID=UPI0033D1F3E0